MSIEKLKVKFLVKFYRFKYRKYYNSFEEHDCNASKKYIILYRKSSLKFLYLIPKFRGVIIRIDGNNFISLKMIKAIIWFFPNKEIELHEEKKLLKNSDIREIYKISKNVYLNNRYIEEKGYTYKNEIFRCDINTYVLILEKLESLTNFCRQNFIKQDEQVLFIISQLDKYIKYINYHDYRTCLANALLLRAGVCIDYAITLYKCLEEIGIECKLIGGISSGNEEDINSKINILSKSNHAWNQIKINDTWYNIDLTWFSTSKDIKWLLSSDEVFEEDFKHITSMAKKTCKKNYDRGLLLQILTQMNKYENVIK